MDIGSRASHLKVFAKVPELLVGDGLYGGCVDSPGAMLGGERQRILCHSRLACAGVSGHKHTVPLK